MLGKLFTGRATPVIAIDRIGFSCLLLIRDRCKGSIEHKSMTVIRYWSSSVVVVGAWRCNKSRYVVLHYALIEPCTCLLYCMLS